MIKSLGYGHSTPATKPGKMFTVAYCTLGIPLAMIMFQVKMVKVVKMVMMIMRMRMMAYCTLGIPLAMIMFQVKTVIMRMRIWMIDCCNYGIPLARSFKVMVCYFFDHLRSSILTEHWREDEQREQHAN